ncbi:hypothetical protein [Streptomyces sp. NPDC051909]
MPFPPHPAYLVAELTTSADYVHAQALAPTVHNLGRLVGRLVGRRSPAR